jgi:hypothetical protein
VLLPKSTSASQKLRSAQTVRSTASSCKPLFQAAETKPVARPRRSPEEIKAILDGFRAAVRSVVPEDRDILSEFLADRRAEAERE